MHIWNANPNSNTIIIILSKNYYYYFVRKSFIVFKEKWLLLKSNYFVELNKYLDQTGCWMVATLTSPHSVQLQQRFSHSHSQTQNLNWILYCKSKSSITLSGMAATSQAHLFCFSATVHRSLHLKSRSLPCLTFRPSKVQFYSSTTLN